MRGSQGRWQSVEAGRHEMARGKEVLKAGLPLNAVDCNERLWTIQFGLFAAQARLFVRCTSGRRHLICGPRPTCHDHAARNVLIRPAKARRQLRVSRPSVTSRGSSTGFRHGSWNFVSSAFCNVFGWFRSHIGQVEESRQRRLLLAAKELLHGGVKQTRSVHILTVPALKQ